MSLGDIKTLFLRKKGFENNQKIYCYLLVFDFEQAEKKLNKFKWFNTRKKEEKKTVSDTQQYYLDLFVSLVYRLPRIDDIKM